MVISAIGIGGIATLGEVFFRSWRESRHLVALQEDIDLASYLLKGVMEEATDWLPGEGVSDEATVSSENWTYHFEKVGRNLEMTGPAGLETVVSNLQTLQFTWSGGGEPETVWIRVVLEDGGRRLENDLLVVRRN